MSESLCPNVSVTKICFNSAGQQSLSAGLLGQFYDGVIRESCGKETDPN